MKPSSIGTDSPAENYFLAYGVSKPIPEGHLGTPPTVVTNEGLSLHYSDAPSTEFDLPHLRKNLGNMEWLEKNVLEFHRRLDVLYRRTAFLPFPFPTVFTTRQAMRDLLRSRKDMFTGKLDYFAGKHEWGIKTYVSRAFFQKWIVSQGDMDPQEDPMPPGARFLETKRRERENDKRTDRFLDEIVAEVRTRIQKVVLECKEVDFLKGFQESSSSLEPVSCLAVLVVRDAIVRLDSTVKELNAGYKKKGALLRVSGPWPPYNFIQLEE